MATLPTRAQRTTDIVTAGRGGSMGGNTKIYRCQQKRFPLDPGAASHSPT